MDPNDGPNLVQEGPSRRRMASHGQFHSDPRHRSSLRVHRQDMGPEFYEESKAVRYFDVFNLLQRGAGRRQ